ncbi:MAG: NAD(P)-dependent oxidoreductase [Acidimicrobiales bacterium]
MTLNPPSDRVALLGLGIMGTGMAQSMLRAGIGLTVWNRSPGRTDGLDGARVAATPSDAVDGAGVVITMLSDAAATEAVIVSVLPTMGAGALWIQMGTIGLDATTQLAAAAAAAGVGYVDAPVAGTKQPALEGKLSVIAAGPAALRQQCEVIFSAVGQRTTWVSERPGDGTRLKLVLNGWLVSLLGGLGEAIATAEAIGIDPAAFLAFIDGGSLGVPYAQAKGKSMIARSFPTSFSARLARKDAGLVADAARDAGLSLPVNSAVAGLFDRVIAAGRGDDDMAAIVTGVPGVGRS